MQRDFLPSYIKEEYFKNGTEYLINLTNGDETEVRLTIRNMKTEREGGFDLEFFKVFFERLIEEIHQLTSNRRRRINILFYRTFRSKHLPTTKADTITVDHVNSGLCYLNSPEDATNILIHREEEFYKVLIHEMLHLYNVIPHDLALDEQVRVLYGLDHVNTNEALVELNALVLNNVIIHKMYGIPLETLMKRENEWSIRKVRQLFDHFDISITQEVRMKWRESTHAFSYFVVKTLLLIALIESTYINNIQNVDYHVDYNVTRDSAYLGEINFENVLMTINDAKNAKLLKDMIL